MYDQSKKLASCHLFDDIRRKRKTTLIRTIRKEQPEKMWLLFCLADWLGAWVPSPCGDSPILASPVATGEVASMRADGGTRGLHSFLTL